jgi:hypothetical protein
VLLRSEGQPRRPRLVRTSSEFQHPVGQWSRRLMLKGEVRRKRQLFWGIVRILSEGIPVAVVEAVLVVLPATEPDRSPHS